MMKHTSVSDLIAATLQEQEQVHQRLTRLTAAIESGDVSAIWTAFDLVIDDWADEVFFSKTRLRDAAHQHEALADRFEHQVAPLRVFCSDHRRHGCFGRCRASYV